MLEDSAFTYQYDNNGNLTRKTSKTGGPLTAYEYDAENKLVRATVNGTTANYKYDGLGRRVDKEVVSVGTTVTRYIYDAEDILLELDGSNNITARYTHGPGIDEPLILERSGASFFYHADALGSITEITDTSGNVVESYTYSSFGKIESQLDPNFVQPYTFTSREFDPETGLYFYRNRSLDPLTGRFLQEDPLGLEGGDLNFYPYARNAAVNFSDPFGIKTFTIGGSIQLGVLARVVGLQQGALVIDTKGNVGTFTTTLPSGALGIEGVTTCIACASGSGFAQVSNAEDIFGLAGPFKTTSGTVNVSPFTFAGFEADRSSDVSAIGLVGGAGFSFPRLPGSITSVKTTTDVQLLFNLGDIIKGIGNALGLGRGGRLALSGCR